MATRKSINSALKLTPQTPTTAASVTRKFEQSRIKLGYMDFASEAKMNRLVAGFLRANGYRAPANRFTENAKFNALMARSCRGK
jgi:hypothetical protein